MVKAKKNNSSNIETVKQSTANKKRNVNMDLLRVFAVFSVISVHFFLNTGFYAQITDGKASYFAISIRTFFMICVPLFMILSGFLMNKKTLSKKYYGGIVKIIAVYVLASIACLAFRINYLNEEIDFWGCVKGIFDYSAAPYSWYINMYIGLFLIIPFLNLIYNSLKSKKEKLILIFTFIGLTSLPTIINYQFKVFPDFWGGIYPVTYYFIGAFINEFEIKIKKRYILIALIFCVLAFAGFNYYRSYGQKFEWGSYCGWSGFENLIDSTLVFLFIHKLNLEKLPNIFKKALSKLSGLALGAYLLSYIFDKLFYTQFNLKITDFNDKMPYYLVMVPLIFTCSMVGSYFINLIISVFKGKEV